MAAGDGFAERDGVEQGAFHRGAADDDVMGMRLTERVGQGERSAGEFFGESAGVLESAGGDGHLRGAARDKRLHDLTADIAGAEHEHAGLIERTEDALRELHGDVTEADLALRDTGMRARPGAGLEGTLEDAVQHGTRHAARERIGIGVLDLTRDLDLAHHLRFEARDDGEEMLDGLEAGHGTEMLIKDRGRRTGGLDERAAHVERGGFVADAVSFETVAGGQEHRLGETGLARGGIESLGASGGHGERRPLVETGGAMGGAERHEVADAFAHRAPGSER